MTVVGVELVDNEERDKYDVEVFSRRERYGDVVGELTSESSLFEGEVFKFDDQLILMELVAAVSGDMLLLSVADILLVLLGVWSSPWSTSQFSSELVVE